MSLNDLPAELTAHVVSYLALVETTERDYFDHKTSISQYASTPHNIQHAIEQRLFSQLTITSDDLTTFEELVSSSRARRALLRGLTFQPILPAYGINLCTRFKRPNDRKRNDETFSIALEKLFTALVPFNEDDGGGPLHLTIHAPFSPSDVGHRDESFGNEYGYFNNDLSNARFAHSYLHVDHHSGFPSLNKITQFNVSNTGPRLLAPDSIVPLFESLTRVDDLFLQLNDNEKLNVALRKRLGLDFAQALARQQSTTLSRLEIEYLHESPGDHRATNSDVRDTIGESPFDPLSVCLSRFVYSCEALTEVRLKGPICADETLFWPPPVTTLDTQWAQIKSFVVDLSCVRPDGGWYLDEHTGFPRDEPSRQDGTDSESDNESSHSTEATISYDDESITADRGDDLPPDSCDKHKQGLRTGDAYILRFRSQPTEQLERVWSAAARACALMPKLEMMTAGLDVAGCPRTDDQDQEFFFLYYAKGSQPFDSDDPAPVPELRWNAPSEWKMSEDLEVHWRKVLGPTGVTTYEYW